MVEPASGEPKPPDAVSFTLDGSEVSVPALAEDGSPLTLLEALRAAGVTSAKDGCAPQGQCGCCTVLVDGAARVACVTPLRRVGGRTVETLEGLDDSVSGRWAEAMVRHGGTQCGFCTPGIIMRLEDRRRRGEGAQLPAMERALAAHLCRCTGWHGIVAAADEVLGGGDVLGGDGREPCAQAPAARRRGTPEAAARRAALETGGPQQTGPAVALGRGGFAVDTAPAETLVAVPDGRGGWAVAESAAGARRLSGKVQGRRSTAPVVAPLEPPAGDWAAILSTSWVEPAYLETDAAWCEPGGEPASVLSNGGAFGAKLDSPLPAVARRLADQHRRAVLALWSREDVVRHGPKRPPVAAGMAADGTGILRVVRTPGIAAAVAAAAPGLVVQECDVPGPSTSAALRAAGWAEALCLCVAAGVGSPLGGRDGEGVRAADPDGGGWARVEVSDGALVVTVAAGDPLDEVVLGSFVEGACHMAAGWVTSEGLAVDAEGEVLDLTVRSFGILRPADTPEVRLVLDGPGCAGEPRAVGAAVFAAAAAAIWAHRGFPPSWPAGLPVLVPTAEGSPP